MNVRGSRPGPARGEGVSGAKRLRRVALFVLGSLLFAAAAVAVTGEPTSIQLETEIPIVFAASVPPAITAISPFFGQPGDEVTITGTGFDTSSSLNEVRFGPNRAAVLSATATELTVQVPNGQPLGPTNITITVGGETSSSQSFFTIMQSKIPTPPNPPYAWCSCEVCLECYTSISYSEPADSGGEIGASSGNIFSERGEFYQYLTDLAVPGRPGAEPMLVYAFQRQYRAHISTDGPLGHNWDHIYFERLEVQIDGSVIHNNGLGRDDRYLKNNADELVAPPELYTELVQKPDSTFELRYRGGTVKTFDEDGKFLEIRGRNENLMTFHYDAQGQLIRVNDTLGRDIVYRYLTAGPNAGRLQEIEDWFGRKVKFAYDANGDLVEVTSPIVTGTPNGNDFPQGKTTRYTYSSGFADERLNHNLLTVTRPNEVAAAGPPVLINAYGTNSNSFDLDKVISQTYGGTNTSGVPAGGTFTYTYEQLNAGVQSDDPSLPVSRTTETDRNGNVEVYEYNRLGYPVVRREFTKGLRAGEPAFFETRHEYNADGRLLRTIYPEGNSVEYGYDQGNPDRLQRGNRIREKRIPDPARGGDQAILVTTYTFEPRFNQVKTITDPRGNDASFVPPNGGSTSPARYTTTYTFDYEVVGDVVLNPGGFEHGNFVKTQEPTVLLLDGSLQTIETTYDYNRFGQVTTECDPEGNRDAYLYHPENDPDGDGNTAPGTRPGLDSTTGGYLREMIDDTDTTCPQGRTETASPVQISHQYFYDPVGNPIQSINARGIQTNYVLNELNQAVQIVRAAALPEVATADPPEPLPLTAFAYVENVFYDFNDNVVRREVEDRGNTSNTGGFVDSTYQYDILDDLIEKTEEVSVTKTLVTRYRYDGNENGVLAIYPEGNANDASYDERDLLFQSTRGTDTRPPEGLYASADPGTFVRPGGAGTIPSIATYNYDQNENLIETVDEEGNGGTSSSIAGLGDVTRTSLDGYDRRKTVTDPLGNEMTFIYDPASNIIRAILDGDPVDDEAGGGPNKTLGVTEYVHDELSRAFVVHRGLFQTPDAIPARTPTLTDSPAMDSFAVYLSDANSDNAGVPGATGITVVGRVSTITGYDRLSRGTFTMRDDLDTYRIDYDGADRMVNATDSALSNGFSGSSFNPATVSGNTIEIAYDDNSNIIELLETDITELPNVDPERFRATYFYDSLDRLQTQMDNRGQTIDYRYDSRNNLVATADAVGPVNGRSLNRRGVGSATAVTVNDFGNVTRRRYDGINRLLETEAILTQSVQGDGTNIGATLEGVLSTSPTPDTSQSGDGLISTYFAYDDNSQLLALRDDNGNTTGYVYDNQNRLIKERKGINTGFQGTAFALTDGDSGSFNVALRGGVGPVETEPGSTDNGTTIASTYDRDNNTTRIVDEDGNQLDYTYDALNRRKKLDISRATAFIGTTQQIWKYDGLSRLTDCADNNEPTPTNDDIESKYFYDSLSRKVEESQKIGALSAKAISCDYDIASGDAIDLPTRYTYPDGRKVDNFYDRLDRLIRRRDNGQTSDIGKYDYIGKGRVAVRTYQNETRLTHVGQVSASNADTGFDSLRRIVNHRWEGFTHAVTPLGNGTLIVGFGHQDGSGNPAYDRENNKLIEEKLHDTANSEVYEYDSVYRLNNFNRGVLNAGKTTIQTASTNPGALQAQKWTLDGLGNWMQNQHTSAGVQKTENRTHSDFNEIRTVAGAPFGGGATGVHVLDRNGNITDDGVRLYQWDALDRLHRVSRKSDNLVIAKYAYDCQNRRVTKDVSNGGFDGNQTNGRTDFYYDGWRVLEEHDGADAIIQQYVYGLYLDEPWTLDDRRAGITLAQLNDGAGSERRFYHHNTLYHTYALTDELGAINEGYQYDMYGTQQVFTGAGPDTFWYTNDDPQAGTSAVNNPYTFTGRRFDSETGHYFSRLRYYSPQLGRFISRDPLGYAGGIGLYEYVESNVARFLDPFGLTNGKVKKAIIARIEKLRTDTKESREAAETLNEKRLEARKRDDKADKEADAVYAQGGEPTEEQAKRWGEVEMEHTAANDAFVNKKGPIEEKIMDAINYIVGETDPNKGIIEGDLIDLHNALNKIKKVLYYTKSKKKCGTSYKNGMIEIYKNTFSSTEQLIGTLFHEGEHERMWSSKIKGMEEKKRPSERERHIYIYPREIEVVKSVCDKTLKSAERNLETKIRGYMRKQKLEERPRTVKVPGFGSVPIPAKKK